MFFFRLGCGAGGGCPWNKFCTSRRRIFLDWFGRLTRKNFKLYVPEDAIFSYCLRTKDGACEPWTSPGSTSPWKYEVERKIKVRTLSCDVKVRCACSWIIFSLLCLDLVKPWMLPILCSKPYKNISNNHVHKNIFIIIIIGLQSFPRG